MRSMFWWFLPVIAGCSTLTMGPFPRTTIPSEIAAGANERLGLITSAQGAQVYRCDAKKDAPGQFSWVFRAPEANMIDDAGKKAGRHYEGPTWEALDGSKVTGTVQASKDAPGKSAIPWLRLAARPAGSAGVLSKVTTIQRVSTSGGLAPPPANCNGDEHGKLVRVEYSADYYFYVPK
ncbi:MAG: DUF3455 domain-containing protein [Betaproteobacteria bacterium]